MPEERPSAFERDPESGATGSFSAIDRRRAPRLAAQASPWIRGIALIPGEANVRLVDISRMGARIETTASHEPGDATTLLIEGVEGQDRIEGRIVRSERSPAAGDSGRLRRLAVKFERPFEGLRLPLRMPFASAAQAEALYRLAVTDHLTGSYNRRFFEDVIARELLRHQRYGLPLAVLFVDVDDLKRVNDSSGHLEGDRLLKHVAELLGRHIRGSDYVFRWGGDEFLVLSGCTREQAGEKAAQLKAAFARAAVLEGFHAGIGLSIGWAEFGVDDGTVDEILRIADQRMYEDKRAGQRTEGAAAGDQSREDTRPPARAEASILSEEDAPDPGVRRRVLEQALAEAVARCEELEAEHARERERLDAARRMAEIRNRVLEEQFAADRSALEAKWAAEVARDQERLSQAESERDRLLETIRQAEARHVAYQAEVREQLKMLAVALGMVERQIRSVTEPLEAERRPPNDESGAGGP